MDVIKVMERFPDQEACIAYLEAVRWCKNPPISVNLAILQDR